jgi:hypothetical protein
MGHPSKREQCMAAIRNEFVEKMATEDQKFTKLVM